MVGIRLGFHTIHFHIAQENPIIFQIFSAQPINPSPLAGKPKQMMDLETLSPAQQAETLRHRTTVGTRQPLGMAMG
jgi:hypothetical protein